MDYFLCVRHWPGHSGMHLTLHDNPMERHQEAGSQRGSLALKVTQPVRRFELDSQTSKPFADSTLLLDWMT